MHTTLSSGLSRRILLLTVVLLLSIPSLTGVPASAAPGVPRVPDGWPKAITIPKINVSASLESIAMTDVADGKAPHKWEDAGWYSAGPKPGERGNAFVFGHLDSYCCPAVFWNLHQLQAGDQIQVRYRDGSPLTFRVMWQRTYANEDMPLDWIYWGAANHALVLATCSGTFHGDGTGYDHKLVVFARLVLPGGGLG